MKKTRTAKWGGDLASIAAEMRSSGSQRWIWWRRRRRRRWWWEFILGRHHACANAFISPEVEMEVAVHANEKSCIYRLPLLSSAVYGGGSGGGILDRESDEWE